MLDFPLGYPGISVFPGSTPRNWIFSFPVKPYCIMTTHGVAVQIFFLVFVVKWVGHTADNIPFQNAKGGNIHHVIVCLL